MSLNISSKSFRFYRFEKRLLLIIYCALSMGKPTLGTQIKVVIHLGSGVGTTTDIYDMLWIIDKIMKYFT